MKRNTDREGAAKTLGQATHTPEPWEIVTYDGSIGGIEDRNGDQVAQTSIRGSLRHPKHNERRANAERIVACVNALEGIANPAAVAGLVRVAKNCAYRLNECECYRASIRCPGCSHAATSLSEALAALDAPVPKTEEEIS